MVDPPYAISVWAQQIYLTDGVFAALGTHQKKTECTGARAASWYCFLVQPPGAVRVEMEGRAIYHPQTGAQYCPDGKLERP